MPDVSSLNLFRLVSTSFLRNSVDTRPENFYCVTDIDSLNV